MCGLIIILTLIAGVGASTSCASGNGMTSPAKTEVDAPNNLPNCKGNVYLISSAKDLATITLNAADTVVIKDGLWENQTLVFKGKGTEKGHIVVRPQTPGGVILSGNSVVEVGGSYIDVYDLYFRKGYSTAGKAVFSFKCSDGLKSTNCRLSGCVIDSYNPQDVGVDYKWISLFGTSNRVDHCSFINKTNMGTLMVVWLDGSPSNHTIDHNYFGYRNPNLDSNGSELNGQEIIRIGDSNSSMQNANTLVESNIFENCNGETEYVSNKSCGNTYRNNCFIQCKGTLTLRHGNGCTVDGNFFFGNGVANTGGVRVIGENHRVVNNYFEKIAGTSYRAAICMVKGVPNSPLNRYFQVKNAEVCFNTIVDCKSAIEVSYGTSSDQSLPVISSKIGNNVIYNQESNQVLNIALEDTQVNFSNNIFNKGKLKGSAALSNLIMFVSLSLGKTNQGVYEPAPSDALANYKVEPTVSTDIFGRSRSSKTNPGCTEEQGVIQKGIPTKEATGAKWYVLN